VIQVRIILSGQCSRALNPANNVKGHHPAAWKPDACKLARCSIFSVPSALFRVRPTSRLIFRLVVSAYSVFRLQEYITPPHGSSPVTTAPGRAQPPHRVSIPPATHSRISVLTLTPLYPHRLHGRSTRASPRLVSLKHLESVIVVVFTVSQSTQAFGACYRTPIALEPTRNAQAIQEIELAGIHDLV